MIALMVLLCNVMAVVLMRIRVPPSGLYIFLPGSHAAVFSACQNEYVCFVWPLGDLFYSHSKTGRQHLMQTLALNACD